MIIVNFGFLNFNSVLNVSNEIKEKKTNSSNIYYFGVFRNLFYSLEQ